MNDTLYKVENWLRKPDFDSGVKLYDKHGGNDIWKGMFKSLGRTSVTEKKLIGLINQLFEEMKAVPKVVEYVKMYSPKKQEFIRELKIRNSDLPDAPEPVLKLVTERKALWRQAFACFNQLELLPNDAERLVAAKIINENWRRITRIWAMTNEFDETGTLPKEAVKGTIVAKDINSIHKMLCGLRSKRSKIKAGRLRRFTIEQPEIDQLAQIEADIDELEHLVELTEVNYEFIQQ